VTDERRRRAHYARIRASFTTYKKMRRRDAYQKTSPGAT
jgi:hypothetical protein